MDRMRLFKHGPNWVFHILLFIGVLLLNFSDLRVLYAPFEYAPNSYIQCLAQSLVLCGMHLICICLLYVLKIPYSIAVIINLLSVNSALWACSRVLAFTVTFNQEYMVGYEYFYLQPLLITVISFCLAKTNTINPIKLILPVRLGILGVVYFLTLCFLPLYETVNGSRLWLVAYLCEGFRVFFLLLLLLFSGCHLLKHISGPEIHCIGKC